RRRSAPLGPVAVPRRNSPCPCQVSLEEGCDSWPGAHPGSPGRRGTLLGLVCGAGVFSARPCTCFRRGTGSSTQPPNLRGAVLRPGSRGHPDVRARRRPDGTSSPPTRAPEGTTEGGAKRPACPLVRLGLELGDAVVVHLDELGTALVRHLVGTQVTYLVHGELAQTGPDRGKGQLVVGGHRQVLCRRGGLLAD